MYFRHLAVLLFDESIAFPVVNIALLPRPAPPANPVSSVWLMWLMQALLQELLWPGCICVGQQQQQHPLALRHGERKPAPGIGHANGCTPSAIAVFGWGTPPVSLLRLVWALSPTMQVLDASAA